MLRIGSSLLSLNHASLRAAAVVPSFPDASTTGPRVGSFTRVPEDATSGTGWNWIAGDNYVRPDDGATLEGLDVNGPIIAGTGRHNVTIRDCKTKIKSATGGLYGISGSSNNWIVEYCEITNDPGDHTYAAGIEINGTGWQVRYNDVSGWIDGVAVGGSGATVEHNYIHDAAAYDEILDQHIDGIQCYATVCDNTTVYHNHVICTSNDNACFTMGQGTNVIVSENKFIGGGYPVRLYYDNANQLINNRIDDYVFGYYTENGGAGTPTISGNVDDSSGAPIP